MLKKLLSLSGIIFFISFNSTAQNEFITTWKTNNAGPTNSTSIRIPTVPGEGYNYDVDWDNDGTYDDMGVSGSQEFTLMILEID